MSIRQSWFLLIAQYVFLGCAGEAEGPITATPPGLRALRPEHSSADFSPVLPAAPINLGTASSGAGIVVEVANQSAQGDVDAHLLNPAGRRSGWGTEGWFTSNDCYYANRRPDWGTGGNYVDDPYLAGDTRGHPRPERIELARPQSGTYRVGIHAFCGESPIVASVRVYCGSRLVLDVSRDLISRGGFEEVADVEWPNCSVGELREAATIRSGCVTP
jgi:hypothetical protein